MSEEYINGLVYYIDMELIKKAREKSLSLEIDEVDDKIKRARRDLLAVKKVERALGRIEEVLRRIKEIAAEGALSPNADYAVLNKKVVAYKEEINEIAAEASAEGIYLLNGEWGDRIKAVFDIIDETTSDNP